MIKFNKHCLCLLFCVFFLKGCTSAVLVGTAASVATVTTMATDPRSLGRFVDDCSLKAKIHKTLFLHGPRCHFSLDFMTFEGRVLITGCVSQPKMQLDVVQKTWYVPGVREVLDHMRVCTQKNERPTVADYALDKMIAAQVTAKLLWAHGVQCANYSLQVHNRVVYFMGIASSQKELEIVCTAAQNTSYVTRVISYVRVQKNYT